MQFDNAIIIDLYLLKNLIMKTLFIFAFVLTWQLAMCQEYIQKIDWKDTTLATQKVVKNNGELVLNDMNASDGKLYRMEYYVGGGLKLKAEIIKQLWKDTIQLPRPYPPYNLFDTIISYYVDLLNGRYEAYYDNSSPTQRRSMKFGYLKNGIKTGEWKEYNDDLSYDVSYFDDNGNPMGEYTEYYLAGQLKMKGRYAFVNINEPYTTYDPITGKTTIKKVVKQIGTRTGKWEHYDYYGQSIG